MVNSNRHVLVCAPCVRSSPRTHRSLACRDPYVPVIISNGLLHNPMLHSAVIMVHLWIKQYQVHLGFKTQFQVLVLSGKVLATSQVTFSLLSPCEFLSKNNLGTTNRPPSTVTASLPSPIPPPCCILQPHQQNAQCKLWWGKGDLWISAGYG